MQLEIMRIIADALADPTIGITAKLALVPHDQADQTPQAVAVADETRDDYVAMGEQVPRGTDILAYVTYESPLVTKPDKIHGEYSLGRQTIGVTIAHRGTGQPARKVQDAEYVMRATVMCIRSLVFSKDPTTKTRNDVTLLKVDSLLYGLVQDDGLGALGAVVFTVEALDKTTQRLY